MTASGHILKRPGTMVDVNMGTRSFTIECGVVENSIISVPLLIGNNVPGFKLLHLMMETAPTDQQPDWEDMAKRMKQAKHDQTNRGEKEPTNQEEVPETPEEDSRQHSDNPLPVKISLSEV